MGLLRIIRVPYQPVRSLTVVCTIYKCHVNWCGCTQYRVCWCGGPVTQDDITAAEAERAKLKAKEVQPINRHSWFAQTSFAAVTATDPRSICTTLAARRSDSVSRRQLPVFGKNNESFLSGFSCHLGHSGSRCFTFFWKHEFTRKKYYFKYRCATRAPA